MKKELHPKLNEIEVTCTTCGNKFKTLSVLNELKVDSCSNCHPFYTGKMNTGAAAGRIDKFNKKFNKEK
ncbi:MAG: 50S ribosomal protein L31 [Mycoplasmataceae bacterium]|nr:50S ribosomal protein L31 [Mycoplasmataceae bacterium]